MELMYTSGGTICRRESTSQVIPGRAWSGHDRRRVADRQRRQDMLDHADLSRREREAVLAPRCQFWFQLGDTYYLSDSDSDRYAKVLPRKLK